MARIHLALGCGYYDLTRALMDGSVVPEGIDLTYINLPYPELGIRSLRGEFDVAETGMAPYLAAKSHRKPLVAIPVFPFRKFRHSYVFCNTTARIREPRDLEGKKIGLTTYQNTAAVWVRGHLEHDYDVRLRNIKWYTAKDERIEMAFPRNLLVQRIPKGATLDSLLAEGKLDAAITPFLLPSFARSSPRVKRLFQDHKQVEIEYFRRTGIFPIMHTITIREQIIQKHQWVAVSIMKAFRRAKSVCYEYRDDPPLSFAWIQSLAEEERKLLGEDPYPYNMKDNRKALETLMEYCAQQGVTDRVMGVEELFAENTLQ